MMLNAFMAKSKHLSKDPTNRPPGGPSEGGVGWWIYGVHAALAALANPRRRCRRLVVAAPFDGALKRRLAEAVGACGGDRPPAEALERRDIARLLPPGAVHQGIAVLAAPLPETALADVCRTAAGSEEFIVVVLDRVSDPRNVGAVLRSAAAFGASAVIVQDRHAPKATGALAKAASGALETVPLVRAANLRRALGELKEAGFWCVGLDASARQTIAAASLGGKVALVLGSEGGGLRRLTAESCDLLVRVPTSDKQAELNLSNAAAVALYELARRRD